MGCRYGQTLVYHDSFYSSILIRGFLSCVVSGSTRGLENDLMTRALLLDGKSIALGGIDTRSISFSAMR